MPRPRRAVLQGPHCVLSTSVQGAVPDMEAGRRHGTLGGWIARNRSCRDRRRRPHRDARARSQIPPSLSLGQRWVKTFRAGQLRDKFGSSIVRCLPGEGAEEGEHALKRGWPPTRVPVRKNAAILWIASLPVDVVVTASVEECCRCMAPAFGRRSVPPVQPPARGTAIVMGRERPRLRFAKPVPGPTSGVAHAPLVRVVDLAVGSRCRPGNVKRDRHRAR